MHQPININHMSAAHFGARSLAIGLCVSLLFLVSCDVGGQKVPRYNTVIGEKRLPLNNSEFISGRPQQAIPVPQPQAINPDPQTFMQVEPQSFNAIQPQPAFTPQPTFDDPRPVGFRGETFVEPQSAQSLSNQPYDNFSHQPGVFSQAREAIGLGPEVPQQQEVTLQPPVTNQPLVQNAVQSAAVQQDPFAGLPPLPPPPESYPRLQEVPEVPQQIERRAQSANPQNAEAALLAELERERQLSLQAQQLYAGEQAIPDNYFTNGQLAQSIQPDRARPSGNTAFLSEPDPMPQPIAQLPAPPQVRQTPVAQAPVQDEIVFETVQQPLPAPAPVPAPPVVQPQQFANVTPQPSIQYQQPLAPIQLRAPSSVTQPAPIRLQAPRDPYGSAETLRGSRYVSRYATRRLQTPGGVY